MKNKTFPLSIFFFCLFFSQLLNGQNSTVQKAINIAISNNTKIGKYYLAKVSEKKSIEVESVKEYCKNQYDVRNIKTKKRQMYGAIKTVVLSFQFRDLEEVKQEKIAEEKRRKEIAAAEKTKREEQRLAAEERKERERMLLAEMRAHKPEYIKKAIALKDSAEVLDKIGDFKNAKSLLIEAKDIFSKLSLEAESAKFEYSSVLNLLGGIYKNEGKPEMALANLEKALLLREEIASKDTLLNLYVGETMLNIGHLKYLRERYREAINILRSAIRNLKPFEDSYYLAEAYGLLGLVYQDLEYYEDALFNYKIAIEKFEKNSARDELHKFHIGKIDRYIGMSYYFLRSYESAKEHLIKSVDNFREIVKEDPSFDNEAELVRSLMLIGEINITKIGDMTIGLTQLEEAYNMGIKYYNTGDYLFDKYINQIIKLRRKYG